LFFGFRSDIRRTAAPLRGFRSYITNTAAPLRGFRFRFRFITIFRWCWWWFSCAVKNITLITTTNSTPTSTARLIIKNLIVFLKQHLINLMNKHLLKNLV
jgi:hypothetical protein